MRKSRPAPPNSAGVLTMEVTTYFQTFTPSCFTSASFVADPAPRNARLPRRGVVTLCDG